MPKTYRTEKRQIFEADGLQYSRAVNFTAYDAKDTNKYVNHTLSLKEARDLRACLDVAISKATKR